MQNVNGLFVQFYKKGGKDFVKIVIPGDSTTEYDQPVKQTHKDRWPDLWRKYESGMQQEMTGTPIKELGLDEGQILALNGRHVYTVETLAGLSESSISGLGLGTRGLVEQAKAFLAQRTDRDTLNQYAKTVVDLQAVNKDLYAKIAALETKLGSPKDEEEVKRRGRPPKE